MRDWLALARAFHEAERHSPSMDAPSQAVAENRAPSCAASVKTAETASAAISDQSFGAFGTSGTVPLSVSDARSEDPDRLVSSSASAGIVEWREGFRRLSAGSAPCPGFARWSATYASIGEFLDVHAAQAALHWSTLDLFGVHPVVGALRGDCAGALTGRHRVTEILPDSIRLGHLTYRRRDHWYPRVALWDFVPGGAT